MQRKRDSKRRGGKEFNDMHDLDIGNARIVLARLVSFHFKTFQQNQSVNYFFFHVAVQLSSQNAYLMKHTKSCSKILR